MRVQSSITCEASLELMSPFIDSMIAAEDSEFLQSHLSACQSCRRQLQSFISLRNLVAGVEPVPVPEDLQLDTRVKLSHERLHKTRERWEDWFNNILKPFAMPAAMGVMVTLLGFGIVLASLSSSHQVVVEENQGVFVAGIYQPPTTPDSTLRRLGASVSPDLDALSIQGELNSRGQIDGFEVIGGARSPRVDQWLQELVLLSQFRPATHWGLPVRSRIILSFVTVRG
jgi:anti-sigma factor RsiW